MSCRGHCRSNWGTLANSEDLNLQSNELTRSVPPEFDNLVLLRSLILADNSGLSGPLPPGITALDRLERLMAGGTGLCRPANADFDVWFRTIADRRLVACERGAGVYLTQAVQSWDDPVPLLAAKPALLRVFVAAPNGGTAMMPDVRATFFVGGTQRHTVTIASNGQSIPRSGRGRGRRSGAVGQRPDSGGSHRARSGDGDRSGPGRHTGRGAWGDAAHSRVRPAGR